MPRFFSIMLIVALAAAVRGQPAAPPMSLSTHIPDTVTVAQDSLAADTAVAGRKLTVVKRTFSYSQQIALALSVMGFVALMMITTQNFNPR